MQGQRAAKWMFLWSVLASAFLIKTVIASDDKLARFVDHIDSMARAMATSQPQQLTGPSRVLEPHVLWCLGCQSSDKDLMRGTGAIRELFGWLFDHKYQNSSPLWEANSVVFFKQISDSADLNIRESGYLLGTATQEKHYGPPLTDGTPLAAFCKLPIDLKQAVRFVNHMIETRL